MKWSAIGAITLAAAVILGAFGAHGLRDRLDAYSMGIWEKAVFYHFVHAIGLLVVPLFKSTATSRICWLLLSGIILFSGSLYVLAISGARVLGAITPIGGVAFIAAWLLLAWKLNRGPQSLLLLCVLALPVYAQEPVIDAVVNAASFNSDQSRPRFAPGSIASIFGRFLAAEQQIGSLPLPATMAGATVTFDGIAGRLFYVSPSQINLQVPIAVLPPGTTSKRVEVVVRTSRGSSPAALVEVASTGIGVFTQDQSGTGPGVIVNVNSDGSLGALHSRQAPARPGAYLTIYLTGLGVTSPPIPDGGLAPLDPLPRTVAQPIVTIDGRIATVLYAGRAPGFIGLDQLNVQVPPQQPESCQAILGIETETSSSQAVPLFVRSSGTCELQ